MAKNKRSFGEAFLYAEDLLINGQYVEFRCKIAQVHEVNTLTAADGDRIDKRCILLQGQKSSKMLSLCKTNETIIILMTGEQFGPAWIGKAITVQARVVKSFGEMVLAVRVIPPPGTVMRKKLYEQLGTKAVWTPPSGSQQSQKPSQAITTPSSDDETVKFWRVSLATCDTKADLEKLESEFTEAKNNMTQNDIAAIESAFAARRDEVERAEANAQV